MLWLLAQHVFVVAILTVIVSAVCRLARLSAAMQHALWLIVLIKLMTPPLVTWPWAMEELAKTVWPTRSEATRMSATRQGKPAVIHESHGSCPLYEIGAA